MPLFALLRPHVALVCLLCGMAVAPSASADEKLAGKACRSVHWVYETTPSTAFYNEVTIDRSAPGTYFCVLGFRQGYYGLQELYDGRRLLIFSVWDPGTQNDPNVVQESERVKLVYRDEAMRIGRFGGEGTGGQSFFDYPWKTGTTYRLLVTARTDGRWTEFTGWFYLPEENNWRRLVTFATVAESKSLEGGYSFVEDFRRNGESAKQQRTARFGNGRQLALDEQWRPLATARFTADANPAMNINGAVRGGRFLLTTGGDATNDDLPLRSRVELPANADAAPPDDVRQLLKPGLTTAVMRTGVANATRDKPQSKLWHSHGHWWALLRTPTGSAVWKRSADGWQREEPLSTALDGIVGQADVWSNDGDVRAVVATSHRLTVVQLRYDADRATYRLIRTTEPFSSAIATPSPDGIETATIDRDGAGRFWIAYDRDARMWVQCLIDDDEQRWSRPFAIGGPTKPDDLCSLVALPGRVGVIWSNQLHDAVYFAVHRDEDDVEQWQPSETVEQGSRTADDHMHTAVATDGTLWVATKNSVDAVGRPQLVLRVRRPDGRWEHRPYANATSTELPTRPIVLLGGKPQHLILLHTVHPATRPGRPSFIVGQSSALGTIDLSGPRREILSAAKSLNNVTGCKQTLPDDAPWIILASDAAGDVYEAELPRF